ncbi:hypothetical protein HPC49_45835 [Pyxidicoccus fallax]|uniref:YCII-related domain-containing protein n=1 Tax=Pyxidicoccus fallax TaxID=394095 RepID=A0A848LLA8_9BACT|nr:YciI family protein [Pyxidicoccus fallax]NMO18404.1 hypothetical protein [Pyxidicoccus fallax]NPC85503.1 hypothetical protein [Pyxidicoccus fallax]
MFTVLLKFSGNRGNAKTFMVDHQAWLQRGFDDGVFLLAGSLEPHQGGAILAHNVSLAQLQSRVNEDPFVREDVVHAEIVEITPSKVDARLAFLRP